MTVAARSSGRTSLSEPLKARPIGRAGGRDDDGFGHGGPPVTPRVSGAYRSASMLLPVRLAAVCVAASWSRSRRGRRPGGASVRRRGARPARARRRRRPAVCGSPVGAGSRGRRRRHGPAARAGRGSGRRPAVGADLGAGVAHGLRRPRRRPGRRPRRGGGRARLGVARRPEAERGADAGQQRGGGAGVAGRPRGGTGRWLNISCGRGRELRAEQVAERDRAAAGLDDRDGLGRGEVAAPAAGEQPQRLGDRLDRAEVGAGADDDLGAGVAQPADRLRRGGARRSTCRSGG